jgi:hypothetical protein
MLEAHIFRTYQKDLRNLALQERRLRNQLKQDTAELRRLQQEREADESAALERAATAFLLARHRNQPFDNTGIGFEFSTRTFDAYFANLTPARKEQLLQKALAIAAEEPETRQTAA